MKAGGQTEARTSTTIDYHAQFDQGLSVYESFLPFFKTLLPCCEDFLPLLLECSVEIIFKVFYLGLEFCFASFAKRFCFK